MIKAKNHPTLTNLISAGRPKNKTGQIVILQYAHITVAHPINTFNTLMSVSLGIESCATENDTNKNLAVILCFVACKLFFFSVDFIYVKNMFVVFSYFVT